MTVNAGAELIETLNLTIDTVVLGQASTVRFTAKDGYGRGVIGLKGGNSGQVRFVVAKLMPSPGAGEPSFWQSYLNSTSTADAGVGLPPYRFQRGTAERGTLVDNLDGTYLYTFASDLTNQRDVNNAVIPFEPASTHRVVLQLSGSINGFALPAINAVKDVVPAGGAVTVRRDVIETKSCNECHGKIVAHGSRYESGYCVVCHNTKGLTVDEMLPDGGVSTSKKMDMSHMTHGIHSAAFRRANGGPEFTMSGGRYNFGEVGYPQALNHCRKCHEASPNAPQGDNWKTTTNTNSCAGCHASPFFATHTGPQPNNSTCGGCHGATASIALCGPNNNGSCRVEDVHATVNPSQNNPVIPPGVARIDYDVKAVTINASNQAEIEFRILRDNQPMNLTVAPTDLTGGPSFLMAYAATQDAINAPADYNNLGNGVAGGQPATVSLAALRGGTAGTIAPSTTDGGYYIATTNYTFPAGANMRSVTLQGYFTQTDAGVLGSVARHTIAKVATATGDTVRRSIVDSAKCGNCHEWFEAHGGNRVYEVQACVVCHNPNLSSSGRAAAPGTVVARLTQTGTIGLLEDANINPATPLAFPEESQNLRDLVHGLHASHLRSATGAPDYLFVRDRGSSGVYAYNFGHVTYPNELNNCEACHKAGTYDTNLPMGELPATFVVAPTATSEAAVATARMTVGTNQDDLVTSPASAACYGCHAHPQAVSHMKLNGGYIKGPRSGYLAGNMETCNVCHGTGRSADSAAAHKP